MTNFSSRPWIGAPEGHKITSLIFPEPSLITLTVHNKPDFELQWFVCLSAELSAPDAASLPLLLTSQRLLTLSPPSVSCSPIWEATEIVKHTPSTRRRPGRWAKVVLEVTQRFKRRKALKPEMKATVSCGGSVSAEGRPLCGSRMLQEADKQRHTGIIR